MLSLILVLAHYLCVHASETEPFIRVFEGAFHSVEGSNLFLSETRVPLTMAQFLCQSAGLDLATSAIDNLVAWTLTHVQITGPEIVAQERPVLCEAVGVEKAGHWIPVKRRVFAAERVPQAVAGKGPAMRRKQTKAPRKQSRKVHKKRRAPKLAFASSVSLSLQPQTSNKVPTVLRTKSVDEFKTELIEPLMIMSEGPVLDLVEPTIPALLPKKLSSSSGACSCSSTSEASRCPNDDCDCRNVLNRFDFYHNYPRFTGPGANWIFTNLYDSTGAAPPGLTMDCNGAFVDSRVYKEYFPFSPRNRWEIQRYKWLVLSATPIQLVRSRRLSIVFKGTTQTFNTHEAPYPSQMQSHAADDVRLAAGVFMAIDMATGLAFEYFLTNDRVYVGYTRTTVARTADNDYAAFTFIIPVKMRKCTDWHRMKIVLDDARKTVLWYLDGRLVFSINRVGYRLNRQFMTADIGGNEAPAFPKSIQYGFGSVSMLDMYPACQRSDECCDCRFPTLRQGLLETAPQAFRSELNPLLGYPNLATYYETGLDPGSHGNSGPNFKYWGQGSVNRLKYLLVYSDSCRPQH